MRCFLLCNNIKKTKISLVLSYINLLDFSGKTLYNVECETVYFETISQGGAKVCKEKFSEI